MGMGPDIEPMSGKKLGWSHLIKEDEGTNHLPLVAGQSAADFKAVAQIADSRNDDEFSSSHDRLSPRIGSAEGNQLIASSGFFLSRLGSLEPNAYRAGHCDHRSRLAIDGNNCSSRDLVFR